MNALNHFQFEIKKPRREDPSPTALVLPRKTISKPVNDLVQPRAGEDDLARPSFESAVGVVGKLVLASEVVHAESGKIMAMGGITKGISTREMRNGDLDDGAIPAHPMKFLHRFHDVLQVLHHIVGVALVKLIARQRPWEFVQIVTNIGIGRCDEIDVYRPFPLFVAAAETQCP